MSMQKRKAISKINQSGMLLVFPINNRPEPDSLWRQFHPRTKMKWEWSDNGDDKVVSMWQMMKTLSDCRDVIYSKWYQGRATFFSRDLFRALLKIALFENPRTTENLKQNLSIPALSMLEILEMNSPLSTRELKRETELQGKLNEPNYNRGLKELFSFFLIVGFGEVEDGAFPSLAVGATSLIYEDLWNEAQSLPLEQAKALIDRHFKVGTLPRKYFDKNLLRRSDVTLLLR